MATISERKTDDGATHYRVRVRLKGHPIQTATFKRKTDAKKWAQQVESAIREGRHFQTVEAKKHTLAEALDRYLETVMLNKSASSIRAQSAQLEWWRSNLGPYTLADITPSLLGQMRDRLTQGDGSKAKGRSPATVNRYLAALSHVFSVSIKEWGWMEANPVLKVRKLKEPRGRVRFLSDDERERLLIACKANPNPYLYPIVLLALTTGMRLGEVQGIRWQDIDFERRRIVLHHTKNGERRSVPLVGPVNAVLAEFGKVRRLDTDLLFPSKADVSKPMDPRAPWKRALKVAEIEDFRFHDLRHSAASYLAMSGASLAEIAEVLGHKTLSMVKRYAHLTEGHTASVVERMASQFIKA